MLEFLWNAGAFIVAIGLLITIHEFGHFYVARRCGVKVERFSIGFGKPLWQKVGQDGTEYVIALIPLGGYVRMLDGRVTEVAPEQQHQAFDRKPVGQRMAIVAAGPLANFALAFVLWFGQYLLGVPSIKPVLTTPTVNSIAAQAQLPNSGIVTAVAGKTVQDWESFNIALAAQIGADQFSISIDSDGREQQYQLNTRQWQVNPETEALTTSLGINLWVPKIIATLAFVDEQGAAFAGGIRQGDRLTHLNGAAIDDWQAFVAVVARSAEQPLEFDVERNGARLRVTVVPKGTLVDGKVVGKIGVAPTRQPWPESYKITQQFGVGGALVKAAQQTWDFSVLTLSTFAKLFTGDLSLNNLGGPIAIAQGAGSSAGVGLVYFLGFLAVLSVNLGIINLFPLPVLDGGHLLYYFIELFSGKPVPEKVQEIGFRIGSALLLLLMTFAIVNDVARL
ncbi:sigma E protease regulator RseP [uncultured Ferrimonas sp.]|uniref:sigma E protease regulator RseP n=1 Tax=uncultured Ferrimonas sp. TaxID=432640 RepID=UPI00262D102A|nr:sigma E protease regulator RseP [uncultured Ferrimonas sp.]